MIGPKVQRERGKQARREAYRQVDDRDGFIDVRTGHYLGPDRAEHHHRQFLSRLGEDKAANLVTLVGPGNTAGTHGWAHTESEARLLGYSIPGWVSNVEDVPIWRLLPSERAFGWALQRGAEIVPVTQWFAEAQMRRLGLWRRGEGA